MKIASFNANGVRARIPVISKWLQMENPDVLCVQETKVQDKDFPRETFEDLGYYCTFRGQKSFNGVAVLSRSKPEKVSFGFGDGDNAQETRIMTAYFMDVPVVNTYVPQGKAPDTDYFIYKLEWFDRLRRYFSSRFQPSAPLLWTGDFNVAPEPIDVYAPEKLLGSLGYHPREHKALSEVKSWGFVDVFRLHHPEEKAYTFWDYRVPRSFRHGLGWRVDHIWATETMAKRSTGSWVDTRPRQWERPSDHTFILATFKI